MKICRKLNRIRVSSIRNYHVKEIVDSNDCSDNNLLETGGSSEPKQIDIIHMRSKVTQIR